MFLWKTSARENAYLAIFKDKWSTPSYAKLKSHAAKLCKATICIYIVVKSNWFRNSKQARKTLLFFQSLTAQLCRTRQDCITDHVALKWQRVTSGHVKKKKVNPTNPFYCQSYSKAEKSASVLSVCREHNVNKYQVNTGWRKEQKGFGLPGAGKALQLQGLSWRMRRIREGLFILHRSESRRYGGWRQKEQWICAVL